MGPRQHISAVELYKMRNYFIEDPCVKFNILYSLKSLGNLGGQMKALTL